MRDRQVRQRLQQQRRLADARIAADQHDGPLHEAARRARDRTRRLPVGMRDVSSAAPTRAAAPRGRRQRGETVARRAAIRDADSTSVFQALQAGHWPCPLRRSRRRTPSRRTARAASPSVEHADRHARRQRAHQLVADGAGRGGNLVDRHAVAPQLAPATPDAAAGTGSRSTISMSIATRPTVRVRTPATCDRGAGRRVPGIAVGVAAGDDADPHRHAARRTSTRSPPRSPGCQELHRQQPGRQRHRRHAGPARRRCGRRTVSRRTA